MSLNSKQYYTSGRTLKSKGNQTMLNNIEKNAYNPTRKSSKKRQSFVNPELQNMKCGGKVHKMQAGGEVMELTDKEIQELRAGGYIVIEQ